VFSRPLGVLAETMPSDANCGVSCVGVRDVAQLGGLGDGLGTGLEIAGRPSPEGVDARHHRAAAAVGEGRQVIGSTEAALSNLC
jgi:hypothetical protein